ncbi:MAG: tolB protein precursor, periplasmic protein [Gemmatimonadetes bacterium]|nr:tolB protein precursor, periplasmic protein [Gemmatimonadota bacterium]
MKLRPFLALAALLCAPTAGAQNPSTQAEGASWMRYPAISPDGRTLVFTYKGDLWRVAAAGGAAIPLTSHVAEDFMPVWSHDGKQLAFASDRYGNFDVFVMPASGGEARRLTFHSAHEYPYTFSADDRNVVFGAARLDAAQNRQFPTGSQPELYSVAASGGRPVQLLTTPADNVRFNRDGSLMLYEDRKGQENQWRKHHVSAVARDIWIYDTKAGTHRKLTTFPGEDRNPVFSGDAKSVYYLSEESGSFNVHRMSVDGGKSTQLTQFSKVPVRFLTRADDGTLAFGFDGQLYTMAMNAQPKRVDVTLAADSRANNERVMPVTSGARELAVSPNGKEVAFTFRGDVFVASVDGGVTKRITSTPETETGVGFSPDGKSLIYASERGGRWAIYEARRQRDAEPYFYASTVVRETPVIANDHQNFDPQYSPDGKEISFVEDRNTYRIYTPSTKQSRTLLTDREIFSSGPGHHFAWSPDSKWILFDFDVPGLAPGEVGLVRADGKGDVVNLTQSGFNDGRAEWILGGKAMMWFSNRDGLKSVAQTGGSQQDAYAMFFDRDAWERFRLTKEEFALVKEADDKLAKTRADSLKAKADSVKETKKDLVLDLDRVENRKARLTVNSSSLGDALVSKDGETLYYLARFERGLNLWSTNLRTKETKMVLPLNANGGSLEWDKEQKNLFLIADGAISKIDPVTAKRDVVPLSGEMMLDVDAERAAMFDHVWRKTRDTFYSKGYHGIDWTGLRPVYAKYLPHIGNNFELAELMAEMLGELNISHSGATYSGSAPNDDATASLGLFYDQSYRGPGVKIEEVMRDGPLDRTNVTVKPGMIIESVDGVSIGADHDLAEYLNRKAGKNVLLGLADGAVKSEFVVKPVTPAAENTLLYNRWVKRNADEVDKASNGQVGYVHIPGMNDGAYRSTFEDVMGRYADRKGVVIDTRFNGGGDLVADLAMFLSGKRFFDYTTDTRSSGYEPNFRWTKPSVALANEANYSDGHCFAYEYRAQHLGPLIGMPTPGTCTFSGWETLQDGLRWGVPGVGVKDAETGKYLENLQTEPDIKVMNQYDVVGKGKDQQLEAAIAALLKIIH